MKQKITIVDEQDNVIGYKDREDLQHEEIYRVSALWITNTKGEILLAQRSLTKSHSPGKWGPAVAGTVEEGESYDSNIIKEAKEELGLENIKPTTGPKERVTRKLNYSVQWYLLNIDKPEAEFIIQKDEVEEVRWFSAEELKTEIKKQPDKFIETMNLLAELFLDNNDVVKF